MPQDLPGDKIMNGYFTSISVPQNELNNTELAIRTVLLEDSSAVTKWAYILDLDIYQSGEWAPAATHALLGAFEDLHERIYTTFVQCITPETRERIH
jgi:uncharacterized protein (TIGR04255 family)